jgi:hypothetical protein
VPFHPRRAISAGDLRVQIERHAIIIRGDLAHPRGGAFLGQEVARAVLELVDLRLIRNPSEFFPPPMLPEVLSAPSAF